MNEEELFCKLFPDYVYKEKPLSPYVDFFAIGYAQAENRCEELEKENKELKCFIRDLIYENRNRCFQFSNTTCLFNSDYRNRAEELIGEKL